MATFTRGAVSLHYEVHGSGYPVLAFAPGGMRSSIAFWQKAPYDPIRALAGRFRVVVLDQRNAGASRAPVSASDGWQTYRADHLALLDELGVERCHLYGQCIGGAFCLALAVAAPARVSAAIVAQPIGLAPTDNRGAFHEIYAGWADELVRQRPDVSAAALAAMRENLYGGDFAFSVSREEVRRCPVPLLVLRGDDKYHPAEISEEVARIAPRATLVPRWREGEALAAASARIEGFLLEHTPAGGR